MSRKTFPLMLFVVSLLAGCASWPGADASAIVKEYEANSDGARVCYEEALKEDPALQGKVTLRWSVNDKGEVTRAEVKDSEIPDQDFQRCVLAHLKGVQFSKAKRFTRAMVEYAMHFHRVKSAN